MLFIIAPLVVAAAFATGPLDSHEVLGLNAPVSERVTIRKATTYAPVKVGDYAKYVNKTVVEALGIAGTVKDLCIQLSVGSMKGVQNFTYAYNTHASVTGIGYDLA